MTDPPPSKKTIMDTLSPVSQTRVSPKKSPPDPHAHSAIQKADEALASATAAKSKPQSNVRPTSTRNLDLKQNDNSFYVLADLIVSHLNSKRSPEGIFTEGDRAVLEPMLRGAVRQNFIDAVRYRLEHNCPPQSEASIHVMTRQCRELGLDREGEANPLLTTLKSIPQIPSSRSKEVPSPRVASRPKIPPSFHARGDDSSEAGSTLTGFSVPETHRSATESLARQQLLAELRDASKFMAESKTPEAAQFWKEHVVKLQARLRVLHGEGEGNVPMEKSSPSHSAGSMPKEALDSNRLMLGATDAPDQQPPPPPPPPQYIPRTPKSQYSQETASPAYRSYPPAAPPPLEPILSDVQAARSEDMETVNMGPSSGGVPMVDVVAPSNLPAGYVFEAEIDGQRFLATVPSGGVKKGETFSCLMRELNSAGVDIPVGGWRDRLCDCGVYGFSHALFLNTLFCPLLVLGQVMQRLHFDFLGRPLAKGGGGYRVMLTIVMMWVGLNVGVFGAYNYKWSQRFDLSTADLIALAFVNVVILLYSIYAVAATRASLREKFMIREQRCYDLEDFCCATFCMPCAICQMARHTADYDKYDAVCCSATGLPDDVKLSSTGLAGQKHGDLV